jgi:hypothetical protein
MAWRLEADAVADAEFQHPRVRAHVAKHTQTRNDAMIEIEQFVLAQGVDVDRHRAKPSLVAVQGYV